jgi:class 3 adenylate cyclase/tetratricopeptide (TPR) repeat protein
VDHSSDVTLTILFTDVEGSTELLGRVGDHAATAVLHTHERIVRRRVREAGGHEDSFLGDGFLVTFPSTEPALLCAMAVQRDLADHNRTNPDHPVRVRMGVHRGSVMQRQGNPYGRDVHAAARVMGEAKGGEILLSEAVRKAAGEVPGASFVDRGLFWLKGLPERWRLFALEWADREGNGHLGDGATVSTSDTTPFVGRDIERAEVRRAVRAALRGSGCLVMIGGEAGVGKTRLVEEVAREAEALGMRVLVGHCAQKEGSLAYLPFVEILEQALIGPSSPIALRDALGEEGGEIARIVPALRRVIPALPPPLDLPPEQAQRYLWSSIEEFLRGAAQVRPLLLVLEDLHWADDATTQLIVYLTPLLNRMPVAIVGSYRDTEIGTGHPLAQAMTEMLRRRLLSRVSLNRLPEEGVAAMLEGLSGRRPPPELVRTIFSETDGNPFFVEEVFRHLSESGLLLDAEGAFRADLRIEDLDVPESVRLVVGARLERLSPDTRDALAAAAVAGRRFEPAVVGRVADLDEASLTAALDEAERARLIAPARPDPSRLGFVHELIRQTLLADTSWLVRQRLHARTAAALEEFHGYDIEEHAAELAYHLSRSGPGVDRRRLLHHLEVAGDRAALASAFNDAASHYERAISLLSTADDEARATLLESLAAAQRGSGRWKEALATMDQALELNQRLGRIEAIGRLCWAMVYQLTWATRFDEAMTLAQRGLAALGESLNPDRARLLSVTGWVTGLTGDHANATALIGSARELAAAHGDRRALADVLHMATANHLSFLEFERGIEAGREAAHVFEAEGALWDLCSVLAFVEFHAGTVLRSEEASALQDRVSHLAHRLGHLGARFLVLADRIRRDGVMKGDLALTATLAGEEIEVCRQANLPWLYTGFLYRGLIAHWEGRWDEAEREFRTAMELEPPGAYGGQVAMHLALHLAEAGRVHEAADLFERSRPALAVGRRVNTLGAWNTLLGFVEVLHLIGRDEEAGAFLPLAEEAVGIGEWLSFDCRLVRTRAGIAASAAGSWSESEGHFSRALEVARRVGHRIEEAGILRFHARMLRRRDSAGDRDRADILLREAADLFRSLGLARKAHQIEASGG